MDQSNDAIDTARFAIFIRGIDHEYNVTKDQS